MMAVALVLLFLELRVLSWLFVEVERRSRSGWSSPRGLR